MGFGEVIQEISPDRGVTSYTYDGAGRITSSTQADGETTQFAYDAADRLLSRSFVGQPALNQTFSYDAGGPGTPGYGELTSVTDAFGTTTYDYNGFGDVTSENRTLAGHNYTTHYAHDAAGYLSQITYPSGRQVEFNRDSFGRVTGIRQQAAGGSWEDIATAFEWAPLGPLTHFTSFNGLENTRQHDANYRLSNINVADTTSLLDKTISRDAAGRVTAIDDGLNSADDSSFTYTPDGRLETATGIWGTKTWTYDPVGNRLSETRSGTASGGETYIYASNSNRLARVEDASSNTVLRDFGYTTDGHISDDLRAGTSPLVGDYDYQYDAANRLTDIRQNGVALASYGYDAFGRRITRALASGASIHYLYDASGRPLAEHDAVTGQALKEYIWLGDLLIAMVEAGQTYAVHGGHLGQPLLMTDTTGNIVWNAEYTPFGGALPSVQSRAVDLRFPGQWEQAEAGLIQNWHRDYDPSLGRYLQADPLGLDAGQSLYGYVGGDPLNFVDPEGLRVGVGSLFYGIAGAMATNLAEQKLRNRCGKIDHSELVGAGLMGTLGGPVGGKILSNSAMGLSRSTKGKLGEALSEIGIRMRAGTILQKNRPSWQYP